jgi:peptidoglycan hydrolase-like protein with peptidoglycan-binding domain
VQQVQSLLAAQGYDPGPADGTVRRKTQDAVRAFQRKEGLPVTGEITPNLMYRLSGRAM